MTIDLPTYADVTAAAARLRGRIVETPVLEAESLNRVAGGRVLAKAEPGPGAVRWQRHRFAHSARRRHARGAVPPK